jgi:hypothetical protein
VELLNFSHFHLVSLIQWTNHLLPATGGSGSCPGGATHTLELGLFVSTVLNALSEKAIFQILGGRKTNFAKNGLKNRKMLFLKLLQKN